MLEYKTSYISVLYFAVIVPVLVMMPYYLSVVGFLLDVLIISVLGSYIVLNFKRVEIFDGYFVVSSMFGIRRKIIAYKELLGVVPYPMKFTGRISETGVIIKMRTGTLRIPSLGYTKAQSLTSVLRQKTLKRQNKPEMAPSRAQDFRRANRAKGSIP